MKLDEDSERYHMTLLEYPLDKTNGLELRIAHTKQVVGCDAVRFPNQRLLPVFVEPHAFVRGNAFLAARLIGPDTDGRFAIELQLRQSAVLKINRFAKNSHGAGLGVFKNGEPMQLIQAVRQIDGQSLIWYDFDTENSAREILDLFDPVA
jgi:hypothetical protein